MANDDETPVVGIRRAAELTDLSMDTLRWYEREGLLPPVMRSADGRRRYSPASLDLIRLVRLLRRTGMPVAEVRDFRQLMTHGAASHGHRMTLLEQQESRIYAQLDQLHDDLTAIQRKIALYADLIDRGLDCDGHPVDAATSTFQRQGVSR